MATPTPPEALLAAHVDRVRVEVEAWLRAWVGDRLREAAERGAEVEAVARALAEVLLRGGKRLRAALVVAGYEAFGGPVGADAIPAAASVELLQAYLLAHDDWMDGDDVRRGGPSVPALLRRALPRHHDAACVLAGDLGAAWAQEALLATDLPAARVLGAARELARVQEDVVSGQVLDVCGAARDAAEVERVASLKTASYTVRAPLVMGARLAGASEAQIAALARFAMPLGVAFQLRDDVLGSFGDARATGKPWGSDLRSGKRTLLVLHALEDPAARDALVSVLGRAEATDAEVSLAARMVESSGALAAAERRIAALVGEARGALAALGLRGPGAAVLDAAVDALTARRR